MSSWWGKSSSKDDKKKAGKESFIDTLQRRFKTPPEGKQNSRSGGSRRRCSDTASEMGSQSRAESRSPSPIRKHVFRCQSFGDRARAQPLPLPGVHHASVERADSGNSISPKPRSEKGSKSLLFLPLPRPSCIRNTTNATDLNADLVADSVSSDGSCDSDDLGDSSHIHTNDYDLATRNTASSPSRSVELKDQSSTVGHTNSKESKKPPTLLFGNLTSPNSPKRRPLGSHVPNLLVPYNGAFCSAPDSSMSSPSKSPSRALGTEKVINSTFWAGKPYSDVNFLGSGQCSSPGSGYNSGHNSIGGDVPGQLLGQQCRGSPECSPIPSPRMTSPGPSSRVQSGAVTPIHPRVGGTTVESQASWPDEGKQRSHPLPLPPVTISNSSPFSHPNSAAASPSLPRSPGRAENPASQGSRWKKGRLLGRGTFGHVYVGFNSESGEMCAMKEVTLFSDDAKSKESAKQLMQEIILLSRLQHPNIVQYYGSDTVGDRLYIFLEYVSGGSIYKILQEYGPLGESAIRSYTQQILSGLAYLHSKNTVHRDIKGANILVDPNGRVKLADFGMAKHITGQSCLLSFKGSPYWMAPEVITNSNGCNLAVDIWSLGCTVVEMATTKPPWSQLEGAAAMFKIGNGKDLPPIPDHLSDEGKDFIWQCLQRNPLHRPTAAKLLEHPFVISAAHLDKPILGSEPSDLAVTNGLKALGITPARSFPGGEFERLAVHSSRVSNIVPYASDIHIPRNVSCPVSPIGSPLLHSRSPQNFSGRMSPSPISSPRTTSGSSTPLTGGSGAIPFNHVKQPVYWQDSYGSISKPSNGIYMNGPFYHDSNPDLFRGMQSGTHIFAVPVLSDNDGSGIGIPLGRTSNGAIYDAQSVLADRVARQFSRNHAKMNPRLDLSPTSPLPSRTGGI